MAEIIPFPVPHRDYDYEMDTCVYCKKIFEDTDIKTEILDTEGMKVNYICSDCCSSVIHNRQQEKALDVPCK